MKTTSMKQFVAVALLAIVATTAQGKSWRINNDVTKNPDFVDINAAMASTSEVADGDTLYLDPGCGLTSEQTISKRVTVIGCGYFRADAPHAMASIVNNVYIAAPYAKVVGVIFCNRVDVVASQVTLERCKVSGEIRIAPYYKGTYPTAQNVTIRQCYATKVTGVGKTELRSAYCRIENCMVLHNGYYGPISELYFPTIKNCYLRENYNSNTEYSNIFCRISHHTIINNIIINVPRSGQIWYDTPDAELVQNNLISSTEGITEANVFALTGADDRRYQLKEDSPAIGAGTDGTDIGPYGGATPYVAGGLPAFHPYYTKAVISPRSEGDNVKVSLQIKMQND